MKWPVNSESLFDLGEIKSYLIICPHPGQLCQMLVCWLSWAEQSLFPAELLLLSQDSCDCHAWGSKKQGRNPLPSSRTG